MSSGRITKLMAARLWVAITAEEEFTLMELAKRAKTSVECAAIYLSHCFKHGVIEQVPTVGIISIYRKTDMVGNIEAPGNGRTMEGKIWEAVRKSRTFTATDIAALATSETMPISPKFVADYIKMLVQCDYVREQRGNARKPSGAARFQLLRDTGPLPPVRKRFRVIVDPNLGEIVHMPEVTA